MIGMMGYGAGDSDYYQPQSQATVTQPQNTGMNVPGLGAGGDLWKQKFAQNPGWTTQQQHQGVDINGLMQGYNSQSEEQRRMAGGSYRANGYDVTMGPGGYYQVGKAGIPGQGAQQHNGQYYDIYDPTGKYVGSNQYQGLGDKIGDLWDKAVPLATMAMIGGGVAGGFGYGPFASGGTGAVGATGGSGAFLGEGALSGVPAWDGALSGIGAAAGGSGGLASLFGGNGSSMLSQLGSKLGSAGLSQLFGSGGSGGGSLAPWLAGGVDAVQQGKASDKMLNWLNTNQAKMEGYMNPDSPEYKAMWEQMSRKDAAAGRNSQYGPRTADFLAKVAEAKANNIKGFTTGTSRAFADAINQGANKYNSLLGALGNTTQGGGVQNLSSLITNLINGNGSDYINNILNDSQFNGGTMSNDDIWNMINGGDLGGDVNIDEWWM